MDSDVPVVEPVQEYARAVGSRLRAIRRQKGRSLQDVEASTGHEFKASVLGAYERGERVISVPRLHRLAAHYEVPVDQLLPSPGERPDPGGDDVVVTFDLSRFNEVEDEELAMVRRYLDRIQVMRQDFNGRVLTIRRDDIRAIAGLFGTDPGALVRRLEDVHLRLTD